MKKVAFFILVWSIYSCGGSCEDSGEIQSLLADHWESFSDAWESEDAEGCAQIYTTDAINIPPGSSIKNGRKEIQAFYQMLFDGNLSSTYSHETINLEACCCSAMEQGEFTVEWTRNDSSQWTFNARSIAYWVKDDSDQWKIDRFIFNNPE